MIDAGTKTILNPIFMKIGYARVSTEDQLLDLQQDALTQASCERIYQEKASGKNTARPELENCLKALRAGDTLVAWRLDRLGRNLKDLIHIVNDLENKGIGFISLTEQIDTSTPAGKLVFHVFAALAEFEKNLIQERTRAGLKAARARGKHGGRPSKLSESDIAMAKVLMADRDADVGQIANRFNVHRTTLYRLVK